MPDRSLRTLVDPNILVIPNSTAVVDVREKLQLNQTVIILDEHNYPIHLLTEEMLLNMEQVASDFSQPNETWPRPTLTTASTPLYVVLQAMITDAGVRWQVVYDEDEILGVVSPEQLYALIAHFDTTAKGALPAPLATYLSSSQNEGMLAMASSLRRDSPPPPNLCFRCPGGGQAHRLKPGQEERSISGLPLCPTHTGTRLSPENPCRLS